MQRRVTELTIILSECSLKDLQIFFPFLVEHIFGVNPSYGNGWGLLRISRKNDTGDFEALYRFLHPFGPFFDIVYRLLSDVYLKYEYSISFLPTKLDPSLREPTALLLSILF